MSELAAVPVRRPWWALVCSVVGALVAVALVVSMAADAGDTPEVHAMASVAPAGVVELADLPEAHRTLYLAAAADEEAFTAVRCYCGCESFLGHEDLLACFVRDDGAWEAHATGCAVCLAEAEEVAAMRADAVPLEEIGHRIDRRYGGIDLSGLT